MKITSGPNQGYYYLPDEQLNDGSPVRDNTVYSRLKTDKPILGFNKSYLTYIDGYYYVPNIRGLDVRKMVYGLENKEIPSSGNTETFLRDLQNNTQSMPDDYCPRYLDPCNYGWCNMCYGKSVVPPKKPESSWISLKRQMMIYAVMLIISFIVILAIRL
jgi:hypothetical protein